MADKAVCCYVMALSFLKGFNKPVHSSSNNKAYQQGWLKVQLCARLTWRRWNCCCGGGFHLICWLYEFILSPPRLYSLHMMGAMEQKKSQCQYWLLHIHNFISLCFCPVGDLTARVRKMEKRRRMRMNQSVNTACSPQGKGDIQYHEHSGRSIWWQDWKTVEKHVVTARKITHNTNHIQYVHTHSHKQIHKPSPTHSLSFAD